MLLQILVLARNQNLSKIILEQNKLLHLLMHLIINTVCEQLDLYQSAPISFKEIHMG